MKIVMVGCGGISKAHLNCIKLVGDELVGAVDTNAENAKKTAGDYGGKAFGSVEELLASVTCDAAIVCSPPNTHRQIVSLLLENGIPVLCEKPLAHTLEDSRALADLADKSKVNAYGAYCHRFNPAVEYFRQMVKDNSLGTVLNFRCAFTGYAPFFKDTWRMDPAISGGGAWMDNGNHIIDIFHYIFGPIEKIYASFSFDRTNKGDDAASVMVVSKKNVPGQFSTGFLQTKSDTLFEAVGTEQSISYDYVTSKDTVQLYRPNEDVQDIKLSADHSVRFLEQYKAFVRAIAGESTALATFADGLAVAEVVDRCYKNK